MRNTDTCPGKILFAVFGLLSALSPDGLLAGVGEWTSNGPDAYVHALAADPSNPAIVYAATDRRLYKSVDSGGHWTATTLRFRATIRATDPRTGRIAEGAAISRADGFGYFSLPGFTGDPSFPEVFVKMVDGSAQPGDSFWVFHTGLTDVEYTLTVTDTVTTSVKTYPRGAIDGTRLCGLVDTTAFRDP